jgi:hypothetical protein
VREKFIVAADDHDVVLFAELSETLLRRASVFAPLPHGVDESFQKRRRLRALFIRMGIFR